MEKRSQMLFEWNATKTSYPRESALAELFEQQVQCTPEAVALVSQEDHLTYAELNRRANLLAHSLQDLGVRPEIVVGLCLQRSIAMIVSLLAILKAGGAYLPLDPSSPTDRLAFMLADAQTPLLLTEESLQERFADLPVTILCLEQWADDPDPASHKENPVSLVGAEHLAYVIYTSGSTGQPKGVCVTHRNVVRLVVHTNYARLEAEEVFLQLAPLAFDVSTFEIWACLLNGARLVLFPPVLASLHELAQQLERFQITTLWLTAGLFHQMVEQHLPSLLHLHQLLAGGEALSISHVRQMLAQERGPLLINGYGPTEGTTFSCCYPMLVGSDQLPGSTVPIGRPIANTQVYVLDVAAEPLLPGVLGELYIGGDGLARGYLHRPELTAEQFVPHPFSDEPGARLYRSGDLVRYLPDGRIEFVGRADRQIKLRGFRIELGEVEAVLSLHPAVQQALVLLREDRPADKRLVAYVLSAADQRCDEEQLRHHLKQRLPDYMCPSAFVWLEAFPLTRNGKIDQRALPAPEQQRSEQEVLVLPRTPLEELLTTIWAQLLGRDQVGVRDNFFALGGHSLLATQMISRLRSTPGVELPLRTLFDAPTIERLAQQIEAVHWAQPQPAMPRLQAAARVSGTPLPLSAAQQRLWFLDQLAPGTPFYNITEVWRLEGTLHVAALSGSLNFLVARHESLRTLMRVQGDRPVQVILPTLKLSLPVIDLSGLPVAEQEEQSQRLRQHQAQHRFELSQGPLLVACLLRLSSEQHLLLMTLHHIITDGWSMGILLDELAQVYEASLRGAEVDLPALVVQYADYALWQEQWLKDEIMDQQLTYWREQLEGYPTLLALPTDRPRPPVQSYQGATYTFTLPAELVQTLLELSQSEGVTLFMTLLAAFGVVLARLSRQERLLIGTPIANRTQQQIEEVVGFFVNTLPLPLDLAGRPSFRQLLGRVREVALGAYAHQDVPFERLVEELQPQRSLSYAPLCQIFFVLQNQPVAPLQLPGLCLQPLFQGSGTAKFDLILEITSDQQGLLGRLEYSQELFELEAIERLAEHYQRLLTEVTTRPEQDVTQIPLLTEPERFCLLEQWNATRTSYPRENALSQLFEQQVQYTPEAVALVSQENHLTYAELNRRANLLAHSLQEMGVDVEIVVGLCLERFFEMIVAMLAILKAGGAYLPLDLSFPADRLAFMLADAQAQLLLTQSSLQTHFAALPVRIICLDQWLVDAASPSREENPVSQARAEHLAYVIYTSGSTGLPKGVAVSHRGVLRLICNTNYITLDSTDRIAQISNVSFDAATFEIWGALLRGGQLVGIAREVVLAPHLLAQTLRQEQITALFLTTALFNQVVREEPTAFASLSYLLFGGEAVDPQRVREVLRRGKPEHLLHVYGPTESTTFATWYEVNEVGERATTVPIGAALANTQTFVLDEWLHPVPIGGLGELYIGGDGLARGYLYRPELTAERFVPHPFVRTSHDQSGSYRASEPGARLYKTGDLVRYRSDGSLDFIGRNDSQVKIRGFRVELGEIEAVLCQHGSIRAAVVIMHEDTTGEKRLIAYIVAEPEMPFTLRLLDRYLRDKLPHYMIPVRIMTLEHLPLSPNGKLDRHALPVPDINPDMENKYVPPHTPIEEALTKVWEEVLKVQRIGVYDNFFELGGHSLLATQVISQIRKTFQVNLPLQAIFNTPRVAELAQVIEQMQEELQSTLPQELDKEIQPILSGKEDAESLLARLDQLSAEEVDALLNSMLSERKGKS